MTYEFELLDSIMVDLDSSRGLARAVSTLLWRAKEATDSYDSLTVLTEESQESLVAPTSPKPSQPRERNEKCQPWSVEDDEMLAALVKRFSSKNWKQICLQLNAGRSESRRTAS